MWAGSVRYCKLTIRLSTEPSSIRASPAGKEALPPLGVNMLCNSVPGSLISSYVLLSMKCLPIIAGERTPTMEVERQLVIHPQ